MRLCLCYVERLSLLFNIVIKKIAIPAAVVLPLAFGILFFNSNSDNQYFQSSFFNFNTQVKTQQEVVKKDNPQNNVSEIFDNSVQEKNALRFVESTERFHIIVSSLNSRHTANKFKRIFKAKGINTKVLVKDNRYRLSLKNFSDKKETINELLRIKSESDIFADAWVYTEKLEK